jgi:hypothetical protein
VRGAPPRFQRRVFAEAWPEFARTSSATLWDQKLWPCVIVQLAETGPQVRGWHP